MKSPMRAGRAWAIAVLVAWLAHAIDIGVQAPLANLLWSCNVAVLYVAAGLAWHRPRVLAVGVLMLLVGEPFWIIGILLGDFLPTSPLTHVFVPAVGLLGLRKTGAPRGLVLPMLVTIGALTLAARFVSPAEENVNLAHSIPRGAVPASWTWLSHGGYMFGVFVLLVLGGFAGELCLARLFRPRPAKPAEA